MQTESKRQKIKIGIVLAVLFLLIYIPSLFHWVYGKDIVTDIIKTDTIEDSVNADGYIIRDEELLKSPFEGKYIPEVNEGEKVPSNFRIATVLKESSMKTLDDIRKLDEKILEGQKKKGENQSVFSQDLVTLDNDTANNVKSLVTVSNSASFEGYENVKKEIDSVLQKKAIILGGFGAADGYLTSLKQERDRLQSIVDSSTKQIISKDPGIISYTVDGLEEELTPDSLKSLTSKSFENIKTGNAHINVNDKNVEINKPFAKIIKGIDIYIAVSLDKGYAAFLDVNKSANLRVNDVNKVVDGVVVQKTDDGDNKCLVVIKTDRLLSETILLRKINVDIIRNFYSGLKVPVKSLIDIDEVGKKAKIVLVKANYASIRDVTIIGKNNEFAVIKSGGSDLNKGISLYDTYVVNPKNIEEGQLIN